MLTRTTITDPVHPPVNPKPPATHYTFATIPYEHRNCDTWPAAHKPTATELLQWFPHLSSEQAELRAKAISDRFDRLAKAIRSYLTNGSLKKALAEALCSKDVFYAQFNRCLMPNPRTGEGIVGWAGLISQLRLKGYTRVNDGEGTAGDFQKWIREATEWRSLLHRMILNGNGGKKIAARKPDVRSVARNFVDKFKEIDKGTGKSKIPLGTYPHDGRGNARRAVERYITNFVAMNLAATAVWFGEDVAAKQHLGTGPQSFNLAAGPLDVLGNDAHTFDVLGIIIVQGPSGPQRIPVDRIQIVANLCHHKRAVTGYSVCIRPQIEAAHVEEAYLMGTTPWQPKKLTIEGLQYDKGAGFPCGSVEGISEVNPSSIRMDNAAQHYAKGIRTRLRQSLGCAIIWGGVGHWWRNAITERFFGTLERFGFQRLPSTTGNGTQDPHRADNPVLEATGKGIEWDELIQLVDVLLANYNAKPHTALGGVSPLDSLRTSLSARHACWFPRNRPPHTASSPRIGIQIERRRIAGSKENRVPPYVEVDEIRYTNECLSPQYDWLGLPVYVHIPKDMRTVEAYLDTGEFIGVLKCMDRGWSLSPHSMQIRKAINALIRKGEMFVPSGGDPVVAYIEHLSSKASAAAADHRTPHVSPEASALAEVVRATGVPISSPLAKKAAANKPIYAARDVLGIALPAGWQ